MFIKLLTGSASLITMLVIAQGACAQPGYAPPPSRAPVPGLAITDPAFQDWLRETSALPAEQQLKAVAAKLVELNPGFDGKLTDSGGTKPPQVEKGVVRGIGFSARHITDLSPVRALTELLGLTCEGSEACPSKLCDLSPLRGLELTVFACDHTGVSDLSPLAKMPLYSLSCRHTCVTSVKPLRGTELHELQIDGTRIADLSPLKGMPMDLLYASETRISDIRPLRALPLHRIRLNYTEVTDLSPLSDCTSIVELDVSGTNVADLSPLSDIEVWSLNCAGTKVSDLSPLYRMSTIRIVDATNTNVTRSAVAAFEKAQPNCSCHWGTTSVRRLFGIPLPKLGGP